MAVPIGGPPNRARIFAATTNDRRPGGTADRGRPASVTAGRESSGGRASARAAPGATRREEIAHKHATNGNRRRSTARAVGNRRSGIAPAAKRAGSRWLRVAAAAGQGAAVGGAVDSTTTEANSRIEECAIT